MIWKSGSSSSANLHTDLLKGVLSRLGWRPALEFKLCATRTVTGYGEPLRDIVLPNEGVRQVANPTKPVGESQ